VLGAEAIEVRAVLAAEVEQVLEPRRRDEGCPGAPALEERVGGHRRPVREAIDVDGTDGPRGREHRFLLATRRWHLRGGEPAGVDEHGVGERPADVDPERRHRGSVAESAVAPG
jgi:hypothetical protein